MVKIRLNRVNKMSQTRNRGFIAPVALHAVPHPQVNSKYKLNGSPLKRLINFQLQTCKESDTEDQEGHFYWLFCTINRVLRHVCVVHLIFKERTD